ncbi:MAG: Tfp pilus tip-associated adhesin PilY1, partial [Pseudohongiellaceae bacterium]
MMDQLNLPIAILSRGYFMPNLFTIKYVTCRLNRVFTLCIAVVLSLSSSQLIAQTNADISLLPTVFASETVKPKVIMSLDNSGSMLERSYNGLDYSDKLFSGFFDSAYCYDYYGDDAGESDAIADYFKIVSSGTGSSPNSDCGAAGFWSGDFLNWLVMRRIDTVRDVLVGGVVKVVFLDGDTKKEQTRRDHNAGSDAALHYIVEGENISIWGNGRALWNNNVKNKSVATIYKASVSPYPTGKYTICSQKILISKDGTNLSNTELETNCGNPSIDDSKNSTLNTTGIAQFKIRLYETTEPTGLMTAEKDKYDFGLAVYNFNHTSTPDTILDAATCPDGFEINAGGGSSTRDKCNFRSSIYRGSKVNGGTLQPCFPDENIPTKTRTNYDKCYETYAGAEFDDLLDVIEYYPLVWGSTPIAETMIEIGGYIKQIDFGKNSAGPQYFDPTHNLGEVPADFKSSYRRANPDAGENINWDPYYDSDLSKYLACTPVYVINLNDGAPYADKISGINDLNLKHNIWKTGDKEGVDTAAWFLRGDVRDGSENLANNLSNVLEGEQDVLSYYVFADLSNNLGSESARKMREAAAMGSVGIQKSDAGIYEIAGTPFPFATGYKPFTNQASGFTATPTAQTATSWDKDGDGEVDHFLLATSAGEIIEKISAVLNDISRRAAASSSAAVVTNSSSESSAIYQALYYANLTDASGKSVAWTGLVWGLFLDTSGNVREDTFQDDGTGVKKQNGQLDAGDLVLKYVPGDNNSVKVRRYNITDLVNPVNEVPIEKISPIWNAVDYLADITEGDIVDQRAYAGTTKGRHILYGDKRLVTKEAFSTGDARAAEFVASAFDYTHAPWFGIDCSVIGTNAQCTTEVKTLVNWLRGLDQTGKRSRKIDISDDKGEIYRRLGDIVASSPELVSPPNGNYDTSYATYKSHYEHRRRVLYAGANDGMIHAFNAGFWNRTTSGFEKDNAFANGGSATVSDHDLGAELWAYMPANIMPNLKWLDDVDYQHVFYIDGDPESFDVKIFDGTDSDYPGGWGTILVVPMRMGGVPTTVTDNGTDYTARSAIVILDITNPENPPKVLGEFTASDLGFTTSKPALVIKEIAGEEEWSLLFGSGPTQLQTASVDPGKKPYIYQLNLSNLLTDTHASAAKKQVGTVDGFVGDVLSIDWDISDIANGYKTDVAIFGTVNINNDASVTGGLYYFDPFPLASGLTPSLVYNTAQPITATPSVTNTFSTKRIYFGTGKLLVPADNANTDQQSFYGLKFGNSLPLDSNDIVNTTGIKVGSPAGGLDCGGICPGGTETKTFADLSDHMASGDGWRRDLNNSTLSTTPSGRSVSNSVHTSGLVLFIEYVPPAELCDFDGKSYLYALDEITGTTTPYAPLDFDSDSEDAYSNIFLANGQVKDLVIIEIDGKPKVVFQDGPAVGVEPIGYTPN